MRLLLDECVDRRLARDISGHEVLTVLDLGWAGVQNGALLARAAGKFDVFVTVDRNLAFQQRVDNLPFARSSGRAADSAVAEPTVSAGGPPINSNIRADTCH